MNDGTFRQSIVCQGVHEILDKQKQKNGKISEKAQGREKKTQTASAQAEKSRKGQKKSRGKVSTQKTSEKGIKAKKSALNCKRCSTELHVGKSFRTLSLQTKKFELKVKKMFSDIQKTLGKIQEPKKQEKKRNKKLPAVATTTATTKEIYPLMQTHPQFPPEVENRIKKSFESFNPFCMVTEQPFYGATAAVSNGGGSDAGGGLDGQDPNLAAGIFSTLNFEDFLKE